MKRTNQLAIWKKAIRPTKLWKACRRWIKSFYNSMPLEMPAHTYQTEKDFLDEQADSLYTKVTVAIYGR